MKSTLSSDLWKCENNDNFWHDIPSIKFELKNEVNVKLALIMDKKLKYKMIVNLCCIIDTLQRRASAARYALCCRLFSRLDMHFKTRYNVTRIEHLFSSGQPYCNSTWLSQTDVLRTYVKQTRLQGIFTSENLSKKPHSKTKTVFQQPSNRSTHTTTPSFTLVTINTSSNFTTF